MRVEMPKPDDGFGRMMKDGRMEDLISDEDVKDGFIAELKIFNL
jgi:hypothetical protein